MKYIEIIFFLFFLVYKSLFHKEHKVEDANALMFRNVRHGVRWFFITFLLNLI